MLNGVKVIKEEVHQKTSRAQITVAPAISNIGTVLHGLHVIYKALLVGREANTEAVGKNVL